MSKSITPNPVQPQVSILGGKAKVLSTDIARDFGRPHERVLRDIAKLVKKFPPAHEFNELERMFQDVEIIQDGGQKEIFTTSRKTAGFSCLSPSKAKNVCLSSKPT